MSSAIAAEIGKAEVRINSIVYDLFGLTEDKIVLLESIM